MTIRIAGTPVALGDRLYTRRAAAWGTVVQVTDSVAVLQVVKGDTTRNYTVTEGGVVAGSPDVGWHAPIVLDLPKSELHKLNKIQTLVDSIRGVL